MCHDFRWRQFVETPAYHQRSLATQRAYPQHCQPLLTGLTCINLPICFAIIGPIIYPRRVILSGSPGFSSRFAVRKMWRLRIFPAIYKCCRMACINKILNTIYREFQLLLFPAGTPPRGKILFLSPKIRFPFYFLNLQISRHLASKGRNACAKKPLDISCTFS